MDIFDCPHEIEFGGFGYKCSKKKGHAGKHSAKIDWSDDESDIIDGKWMV